MEDPFINHLNQSKVAKQITQHGAFVSYSDFYFKGLSIDFNPHRRNCEGSKGSVRIFKGLIERI